jgi:hypothetical protein
MDDEAPPARNRAMQTSELKATALPGIDDLFALLLGPDSSAPAPTPLNAEVAPDAAGIEDYLDSLAADPGAGTPSTGRTVSELVTTRVVTPAKKGLEQLFSLLLR